MKNETGDAMRTLITGALLLAALATPCVAAAQRVAIDEIHPLRAGTAVEIDVVSHTLNVQGWDRSEIQIVGQYDSSVEEMEVGVRDGVFRFEIDQLERRGGRERRNSEGSTLEVRVPRGAKLDMETVSGSLVVSGVSGELDGSSVSGAVQVTGNLTAADLSAVSGPVRYRGNAPIVRLESVSGSVDFVGRATDVRIEAVSGAATMEGGAETIDAESVSGAVEITSSVPVASLDASSVSGRVDFRGALASGARVDVESHSGAVELVLSGSTSAEFELSSFSGRVSAALAGMRDEVRESSRLTPDESLTFSTGSGAGRVRASSFSGSVRITEAR